MENEHTSMSEISSVTATNASESLQNIVDRCKELTDDEGREGDKTDPDLVLDLRTVFPSCDFSSENDESTEKLTAVFEQAEDSSRFPDSVKSFQEHHENNETNCVLQERIEMLHDVMRNLKDELKREMELWRQEREEMQRLRENDDALALKEATAAARAAAAAYAAEAPLSNLDISSENIFTELAILEYEKRLAKYQDEYSLTQAEKRYNARWKQIATAYKQKLMEVERLCNEELEKVQNNASHLQPLKEMMSQWCINEDENHGDTIKNVDFSVNAHKYNENDTHNRYGFQKIDAEVNMAPEIFVARFKSDESAMKDRFCA